jgi:Alpha-2-macroglobulin family
VQYSPLGGELTLADLAKIEPGFVSDRLVNAVNNGRMYQVFWAFVQHSAANQKAWLKDGKWTFPNSILRDSVQNRGLNEAWLTDVWGSAYRLVKTKTKQKHGTAYSQLDYYQLVSAGPDRNYNSRDEVKWNSLNHNIWNQGQWWWLADPSRAPRLNQQQQLWGARTHRRREMLMENRMMLRKADMDRAFARPMAAGLGGAKGEQAKEMKTGPKDFSDPRGKSAGTGAGPPVRVREYFPETLKWEPSIITDDKGRADLVVAFADSITTWRMTASASSRGGALGGVSAPLRVFQDFFVDLDMPISLTQNDEVAFPVAVFNYLKEPQTVRLELKKEPWFDLIDQEGLVRSLPLKPNEVTSVKFRIKAKKIGFHPLEVKAFGTKANDAIRRSIEVVPDGKKIEQVVTDRLTGKVTQTITIPEHALPDASRLMVKLYPGIMSQVLEGTEGMIRLPGG